jgi:DNA-binding MarR family transcriptional regulator
MVRDSKDFDVDDCLPYLVVRVGHVVSRGFTDLMESTGLSVRQFGILTEVEKHDGIGSAEIGRKLSVTPQSVGEQIEILVDRRLLKRDPPRPGRKAGIHLTGRGRTVLAKATALAADYDARLTEHLGPHTAEYKAGLEEMARRS